MDVLWWMCWLCCNAGWQSLISQTLHGMAHRVHRRKLPSPSHYCGSTGLALQQVVNTLSRNSYRIGLLVFIVPLHWRVGHTCDTHTHTHLHTYAHLHTQTRTQTHTYLHTNASAVLSVCWPVPVGLQSSLCTCVLHIRHLLSLSLRLLADALMIYMSAELVCHFHISLHVCNTTK